MHETILTETAETYMHARQVLNDDIPPSTWESVCHYWLSSNEIDSLPFSPEYFVWKTAHLVNFKAIHPLGSLLTEKGWPLVYKSRSARPLACFGAYERATLLIQHIEKTLADTKRSPGEHWDVAESLNAIGAYSYIPTITLHALSHPDKKIQEDGHEIIEFFLPETTYPPALPHIDTTLAKFDPSHPPLPDPDTYQKVISRANDIYDSIHATFIPFGKIYNDPRTDDTIRDWLTLSAHGDQRKVTMALEILSRTGPGYVARFIEQLLPLAVDDTHSPHALQLLAYAHYGRIRQASSTFLGNWLNNGDEDSPQRVAKVGHAYSFLGLVTDLEKLTISALASTDPTIRTIGLELAKDPFLHPRHYLALNPTQ
ncbi:MAG: hypothetical protein Q4C87_00955 [Actinomycetaceae bacterium]|nr:hypothetical protein [Actinomycetaceae bacterium]